MSMISFNTADETTVSLFRNWYTCFARIRHESAVGSALDEFVRTLRVNVEDGDLIMDLQEGVAEARLAWESRGRTLDDFFQWPRVREEARHVWHCVPRQAWV